MDFTPLQLLGIWQKAQAIDATNEARGFRKDACGAWIRLADYGNRDSDYGWEVDHIVPTARGGLDAFANLRPLHWRNNAAKADGGLYCAVTAVGTSNGMTTLLGAALLG